jgi:hypothetical protein
MRNIVCKLIYNNGGEGDLVGFDGACDVANIIRNIKKSAQWCSHKKCSCRKFSDKGFKQTLKEEYPCNESRVFSEWFWSPGADHNTNKPFIVKDTGVGKYALLTTRFPDTPEDERKIIGFFKIKTINEGGHNINGNRSKSLRLPLVEAKELNFWNYHKNKKSEEAKWGSGNFRYFGDENMAAVLHDLLEIVQNAKTKALIRELIIKDFPQYAESKPNVISVLKEDTVKKIILQRKYGLGGEGPEHKKLKEFIARNPSKIGLDKKLVKPHLEHKFVSGDLVDILFEPKGEGDNTVVEIELDCVLPGIHQAIKYRALRCSQLGKPLNDKSVKASIVAWNFSEQDIELCKKYGIDFFEIPKNTY